MIAVTFFQPNPITKILITFWLVSKNKSTDRKRAETVAHKCPSTDSDNEYYLFLQQSTAIFIDESSTLLPFAKAKSIKQL